MSGSANLDDRERNRTHPSKRLSFETRKYDLDALTRKIEDEPLSSPHVRQGHRPIVLQRNLPQTMALYVFEPDGFLKEHEVNGVTSLQVLEGSLDVRTGGETRRLEGGDLYVVEPGVRHGLVARERSRALVTISRRGRDRKPIVPTARN